MNALFDAIIRGSIKSRHLVILAALALVALGVWTARGAHLDALPNFTPPLVIVQAEAPGLGSSAVEQLVTTPLEQALLGIPDVTRARSTSSPGLSLVQLTFEESVDVFRARQLVSERVAEARERLPATMPPPRLAPITAPVGSLLKFAYTSPGAGHDSLGELWRFAQWKVRPRLQAIEGIARVTVHGGAAARIEVRPDAAAMLARGVTLSELREALERAQSLAPLGWASAGAQQEPVRAEGLWAWGRLEDVGGTVLAFKDGLPVRVADVAQVANGEAPPVGLALYDENPAIYLQVEKLPWADTPRLTAATESALADLDQELPPGARREAPTFRQADFIHTSLSALARAMGIGAALVIVVLISFLRSPRLAAISLTALPLSIVAAVAVLLLRGVTLNGMILGGLAIAVGEVVDDAIVDVENIWRRLRENARAAAPRPALEVVREASSEVRGAVVYASLIVVAVLTPVMVLGGLAGRIFSPLAQTYALAVAASLLVALTVTPALAAVLLPGIASKEERETGLTRTLRAAYERVLGRVMRRPGQIVLASAALGAAALAVLPFLGGGFLPEFREGVLIAEVTTWPGTSLEEATRMASRVSAVLRSDAGLPHVAARAGRASLDEDAAPVHRIEMDLVLAADGNPEELSERISRCMGQVPGIRFGVEGFLGERINELLSGERSPIVLKLFGTDLDGLRKTASGLVQQLAKIDGIQAVRSPGLVDVPTTDLRIDEARLGVAGVRRSEVVDAVAAWRQGLEVASVNVPGGFSVPVVLSGEEAQRARSRIGDLPIFSASGAVLPLSSLVSIEEGSEPPAIDHEGGRRLVTITARAPTGELSRVASSIEGALAKASLPPGTTWELAGQAAERREASGRLLLIVGLVLLTIFAFLWMAFGSVVDSAVVLGGLPLGMVGGVVAALLLPEGLSMAGLVGFVALSGIISRNGIMLVAHKNRLLAESTGRKVDEVILQAARERLLPILMTASTAFFGLLPLALSVGAAGSELESPMAAIVCVGLLTSTALNLVAVPAFFLWRERRRTGQEASA
ncbi:MAG TPA: efflux RND transporter permease subunit [Myxococcales bacterium]